MSEYLENKINFEETIKNKLPLIVEYFVMYYGEEYRKQIEEKISKTTIAFKYTLEALLEDLDHLKSQKARDLSLEFMTYLDSLNLNIDSKFKSMFEWYYFINYSLGENTAIRRIENYLFSDAINDSQNESELTLIYLKKFDNQLTTIESMNKKKEEGNFNILKDEIIPKYKEMISKWLESQKKYEELTNLAKKETDLKSKIYLKYYRKFIKESFIAPENEEKIINENEKFSRDQIPITYFYVGDSLEDDNFELNNTNILTYGLDYLKSQKKYTICVLKKLGFDFGEDIDLYLSNPEVLECIKRKKANQEAKKYYREEAYMEFIEKSEISSIMLEQIKKKPLVYTNPIDEVTSLLLSKGSAGSIRIDLSKDDLSINPFLVLDLKDLTNNIDKTLFHELNHRLEMNVIEQKEKKIRYYCGWCEGEISENIDELSKDYMWFNEVINEMISCDVYDIMLKNKKEIFGKQKGDESFLNNYSVTYDIGKVLLESFFRDNFKCIIESRLEGNMNILYKKVGKENFEEINKLVNEFFDFFEGINYSYLEEDMERGAETEITKKYNYFLEKRDSILENISKYKNSINMIN